MKTIIVPTDFSARALNALHYALGIAQRAQATVRVFHAYHLPPSKTATVKDISDVLRRDAESRLRLLVQQIRKQPAYTGASIETIARKGSLLNQLDHLANETAADLIVMGTQGASGITEELIGTDTAETIERVRCPVLVVPEQAQYQTLRHVTFATDYHPSDEQSLDFVVRLAALFDASVHVAHVETDDEKDQLGTDFLNEFVAKARQRTGNASITGQIVTSSDVLTGLNQLISDVPTNLLCMATRRRNVLERIFDRSLTKQMAYHTRVPLLALHIPETDE